MKYTIWMVVVKESGVGTEVEVCRDNFSNRGGIRTYSSRWPKASVIEKVSIFCSWFFAVKIISNPLYMDLRLHRQNRARVGFGRKMDDGAVCKTEAEGCRLERVLRPLTTTQKRFRHSFMETSPGIDQLEYIPM